MMSNPPSRRGEWEIVESVSTTGTGVTFSNLDGGKALLYELILTNIVATSGSNSALYLQFNGDTGSNYINSSHWRDSSSPSNEGDINGAATVVMYLTAASSYGRIVDGIVNIRPQIGTMRQMFGNIIMTEATTGMLVTHFNGGRWTNTADEITSIKVGISNATYTSGNVILRQMRI
jgi:hypothetical protein